MAGETELPENQSVQNHELVIRRFDPTNINHVAIDEGDGSVQLRSGAVSLTRDIDGCSVYRESILDYYKMSSVDIMLDNYVGIARFVAGHVRQLGDIDILASPWPQGTEGARAVDVAHATIVCELTPSACRRKASQLARLALVTVPDNDAIVAAVRSAGGGA